MTTTQFSSSFCMVHLGGESSKLLFDTLAQWNHALGQTSIAGNLPAANSNEALGDDAPAPKSGNPQSKSNVVGIDLSTKRPPRPTARAPKKRPSDVESEVGHG